MDEGECGEDKGVVGCGERGENGERMGRREKKGDRVLDIL